jgi:anaphase-promoting complex subunit 2
LQEGYAKEFITFKPDKQLRWLPHLGTVHLGVELQDRTVEAEATPLEAAIIELFSEKGESLVTPLDASADSRYLDTWTVDELIPRLGSVDHAPTVKALNMWADKGVLTEEKEACYKLLEIADTSIRAPIQRARECCSLPPVYNVKADWFHEAVEEEAPAIITVQQQQAEQMKIHWKVRSTCELGDFPQPLVSLCFLETRFVTHQCLPAQYIQGMLTNVGALPLERISGMLKFVPGYDRTPDQLAMYLESAKREGLVTVKDGLWSLTPEGKAGK